jgi:branched-chain amino acid aminotransferase
MTEPLAFYNGEFIPASQAAVPLYDAGFVLGATVAEQVRTFRGRVFRLDQHLERLAHSLQIVAVDPGFTLAELGDAARELAARNHALLDPDDDLGLSIFVTPGPYPTMADAARRAGYTRPLVCLHTYPLPFHLWADKFSTGQSLVVSDVPQVPADCWPPELKCRSRMHYYLADLQARKIQSNARALLLDQHGCVLETSTASITIFRRDEGIIAPPEEKILPGISVGVIAELAEQLRIPFTHRHLSIEDVAQADETMLCSTSPCVWPVTELDGQPIGGGKPGPLCARLLAAWSDRVGVDIPAQAARFAHRHS